MRALAAELHLVDMVLKSVENSKLYEGNMTGSFEILKRARTWLCHVRLPWSRSQRLHHGSLPGLVNFPGNPMEIPGNCHQTWRRGLSHDT